MTETLTSKAITINQNIQLFIQQQENVFNQKELNGAWLGERFLADLFNINVGFHSTMLWFGIFTITLMFIILCVTSIIENKHQNVQKQHNSKIMKLFEKSFGTLFLISSLVVATYFVIKLSQDIQKYYQITRITKQYAITQLQTLLKTGEITQVEYDLLSSCRRKVKIDINCIQSSVSKGIR